MSSRLLFRILYRIGTATKQKTDLALLSCCLVSLHFLCDNLNTKWVYWSIRVM